MKKEPRLRALAFVKVSIGLLLVFHFHPEALAQQAGTQDPTEESGGIIQRYGRNAANNLESILIDPETDPLLSNYSPVTDEVLQNPQDSDWLTWRRTYNNQGFSNLAQINRETVSELKLAWHQPVTPGNNMPTPLIHDGVMFLYSAGDVVLALDATNGLSLIHI